MLPGEHFAKYACPGEHRACEIFLRRLRQQGAEHGVAEVVLQHMSAKLGKVGGLQIPRAPTRYPGIERDHQGAVAGVFRALNQAFGQLAVFRRVELEVGGCIPAVLDHFFEGVIGEGGCTEGHPRKGRGLGGGDIAMMVLATEAVHADGGHEEGIGQLIAKEVDGQVPLTAVHQHAGNHAPVAEGLGIAILCDFVAAAALHIAQKVRCHGRGGALQQIGKVHREAWYHALKASQVDVHLHVAVVALGGIVGHGVVSL